ncbi:hypothetical protein L3D22_16240 [Lysobacter soli]|uniref:hypothetical protein n=1 Tax=Lysobacter soli TaxID=453783 RepID=UPI0020A06132|nr:hypothetical protein [Lysobacter soli]UTA53860.1 hypothetical protein L3D22_16240 [Lysobacter soli]
MRAVISLSIAAALLAAGQSAHAQSSAGVLRFKGALVGSTGSPPRASRVAAGSEAPRTSTEQTLDIPGSTRAELLDYFVATRREAGIEARELKLFTRTYL